MKKILLFLLVLFSTQISIKSQTNIHVETAGTLPTLLGNNSSEIVNLIITGKLNGDDIKLIKTMATQKLSSLNIADSDIVRGGSDYYTQDNKISQGMFAELPKLTSIVLPNSITSIDKNAFLLCSGLKSITIPSKVISIGDYAFDRCTGLTSIVIPNSVTEIGIEIFYACTGLKSATIGNGLTSTGKGLFSKCSALTDVVWGNKITTISQNTFSDCSSLVNIDIPTTVTSIESGAFSSCSALEKVVVPNGILSIETSTFYGCSKLTNVSLPNTIVSIKNQAFLACSILSDIEIPSSVTSIGDQVFYKCSALEKITIPDKVTSIGNDVFYECPSLKYIYIKNPTPPQIGYGIYDINTKCILYVPKGTLDVYKQADGWKLFVEILEDDNIASINNNAMGKINVYAWQESIVVENVLQGKTITVYSEQGKLIDKLIATGDNNTIKPAKKGVFIICVENESFKVVL